MKKLLVNLDRKILIVKRESIVDKHVRFDGKIVAGMYSNFWGDIEGNEVYLGKGCTVNGTIRCRKAVIGAYTRFNSIIASGDVIVLDGCVGNSIKASGDVRIGNSIVHSVETDGYVLVDGAAKLEKLIARRVVASMD
ncbi:hypothetical protein [Archaeoglobus veneficus]|uniref:Polymer-forming cytoskeletal protein n=1 Tax=Archaeoglobus veneficus (strain DSM 11195 / SNP6) TaxID=693661 RepID=F2KT06_ARCVS|nr:hypothetical protein [Archaeoglobus veneficus]AEA47036.1 hypothetical protein Arcve_1025 [Archaeoglobus veneficus SNP6]